MRGMGIGFHRTNDNHDRYDIERFLDYFSYQMDKPVSYLHD